jgi:hypothetical protein
MARFTLCFILLAAALGHAVEPSATLNKSAPAWNLPGPRSQMTSAIEPSLVTTESPNGLAADNAGICYKIRAYIFKRDDDHAPKYVGSTTCGPAQPRAKDAVWPKARMVPAD